MTSRLELSLLSKIGSLPDSEARAVAKTKLACYLARSGEMNRSEDLRLEIRQRYGDGTFPTVSILLMLLDGLLIYYKNLGLAARDRIARANIISLALKNDELSALTFAWLSHIDFNLGNYPEMVNNIRRCFELIDADIEGAALLRVSLVLGDAFLYANRKESSRGWYEKARRLATDQGDQAAIGAFTYNRCALNVQALRLKMVADVVGEEDVRFARVELQSAISYQKLAALESLNYLLTIATVGMKMVQRDYLEALPLIEELLNSNEIRAGSGAHKVLLSDLSLCLAKAGKIDEVQKICESLQPASLGEVEIDDQILILFNLVNIYKNYIDSEAGERLRALLHEKFEVLGNRKSELSIALRDFENISNVSRAR
jgi:tetratricopeptide (TPR) repeat protein